MKALKKILVGFMVVNMMVVGMTGCKNSGKGTSSRGNTITLAGSTSMEKLCEGLIESFNKKYPTTTVTVEYTGSGAGIESLVGGSVDIGNSSRALTEDELNKGIAENVVALDGIAVITDAQNTITNLTSTELAMIYKGEINNWSQLGGQDLAIVVIGEKQVQEQDQHLRSYLL